jgi:hypothetical protein
MRLVIDPRLKVSLPVEVEPAVRVIVTTSLAMRFNA